MFNEDIVAFASREDGAITVDWVVLTAGIVGLAMATLVVVSGGVENGSTDISQSLANAQPLENPFPSNVDVTASTDVTAD